MIIINKMYVGGYITKQGKLGHETINFFKADKSSDFYIWLNSMGVCSKNNVEDCTIICVRAINSTLYKVLGKAENCKLLPGAVGCRKKLDDEYSRNLRYTTQKSLNVKYNGKCPMDDIFKEKDMFATFKSSEVFKTNRDIYLTNDSSLANGNNIFFADFIMKSTMREYFSSNHKAFNDLHNFLNESIWIKVTWYDKKKYDKPDFNFYKLIKKDKDEITISNSLAHFICETNIKGFLKKCLCLDENFVDISENYQLLREKNNIDISFFGENSVIIIENKIDSNITVDKTKIDMQIKNAIEIFNEDGIDSDNLKNDINYVIGNVYKDDKKTSQLSKYYIYAVTYLLCNNVNKDAVNEKIKCFLLIPEYSKQFKSNKNGYYDSIYMLSDKYKIITYKSVYNYFKKLRIRDKYFKDFISVLKPLSKEFNNDIEEEMNYRFLKAIKKI